MRAVAAYLALVAAIVAGGCSPRAAVRAERAWVRDADSAGTTAAYFTLVNDGDRPVRVVRASASCAREGQLHETVREQGRAAMRRLEAVDVPARGRIEFVPGGRHVMLLGVRRRLAPGDTASLVLERADGPGIEVVAKVRP
jgi:hypothetical protein